MAPGADPVSLRILNDIKSTLEGITPGSDYFTAAPKVELYEGLTEFNEFPAIAIIPQDEDAESGRQGATDKETWTWRIALLCGLKVRDSALSDATKFNHDVEKILKVDWTRGGLANNTRILGKQIFVPGSEEDELTEVRILIEVKYATAYNDPTTPR